MSETLTINPETLTIGDLEDFEDVVGKPIDEALKPVRVYDTDELLENGKPNPSFGKAVMVDDPDNPGRKRPATEIKVSTKVLKALVWISKRADKPDFTLADARKVRIAELIIDAGDVSADPKG